MGSSFASDAGSFGTSRSQELGLMHGRQLIAWCGIAVQLLLTGTLPFAHIEQEAALYSHETHFSASTEGPCIPHAEPTCQVCRAGVRNFLGHSPVRASARPVSRLAFFLHISRVPVPLRWQMPALERPSRGPER